MLESVTTSSYVGLGLLASGLRLLGASLVGFIVGGLPSSAQPLPLTVTPNDTLSLQAPDDLTLEPILTQEIFATPVNRQSVRTNLSISTQSTTVDGAQAKAVLESALPSMGDMNPQVVRVLPDAWQAWLPSDWSPNAMNVTYELQGDSGETRVLSHSEDPRARIYVQLEPLPTSTLAREVISRSAEEDPLVLQQVGGGLRLTLDLRDASRAGRYSGILQITLSQL